MNETNNSIASYFNSIFSPQPAGDKTGKTHTTLLTWINFNPSKDK